MHHNRRLHIPRSHHFNFARLTIVQIHSVGIVPNFASGNIGSGTFFQVGFVDCFEFYEVVGFVFDDKACLFLV